MAVTEPKPPARAKVPPADPVPTPPADPVPTPPADPVPTPPADPGADPETLEAFAFRLPRVVLDRVRSRATAQKTRDDNRPANPSDVARAVFMALFDDDDLVARVLEVTDSGSLRERLATVVRAGVASLREAKKP